MTTISLVKKRMAEMRDGIDDAEVRMKESEQLKREAVARGYASETAASSLKNRMFQVQSEIDKVTKRLTEQQSKLDSAEGRTHEHDNVRKELEAQEGDQDQDLDLTEKTLTDTKVLVTENTLKYDDAVIKFRVLEADVSKAYERLAVATAKVEALEAEAHEVNTNLKDLESRDEEASQRETTMEDQEKFLAAQLKDTIQRAEVAERDASKLERLRDTILGGIELEKKKIASTKDELEITMNDLLNI